MAERLSVDELCARYDNEDAHTEHVTAQALTLFNAVREAFGLTTSDRTLLEAAARLHDVGYGLDPGDHRLKSVEIVRKEGLRGFTPARLAYVLGIMALHQDEGPTEERDACVQGLPQPARALRLGAILCVADGLDHGHIQDNAITGMQRVGGTWVATIAMGPSPGAVSRAEAKAALWRDVFPMDIRFEIDPHAARGQGAVLTRALPALEAVRRLLFIQYRTVQHNEAGSCVGADEVYLHDVRVALRRFCALLSLLEKTIQHERARELDERLMSLIAELGPARDFDVWMRRLREIEKRTPGSTQDSVWHRYCAEQKSLVDGHRAEVRRVLSGKSYRLAMQKVAYFLRIELPGLIRSREPDPIGSVAARKLAQLARVLQDTEISGGTWDAEDFHDLRKKCRRARYVADFFGEILGPRTQRWGRRLKALADLLGDLHDADVGLEKIHRELVPAPRALSDSLMADRGAALGGLDRAWAQLKDPTAFHKLMIELKEI